MTTRLGGSSTALDALVERAETPLILLGDFNDSPFDTSVSEGLGASRSHAPATGALRFPKGRDLAAIESYLQRKIKLFNPCWSLLVDPSSPGAPSTGMATGTCSTRSC